MGRRGIKNEGSKGARRKASRFILVLEPSSPRRASAASLAFATFPKKALKMKSFFRHLSSRFPFFANRPSALERAVRQSPKSRRLGMEPLENRALLAVDAFGGAASLVDSDVGATWGPDPAPAAFSASVLATDAAIVDVSGVNATSTDASFSVQTEAPEPVAPPSFEQLMEALGQVKIESLDDEFDAASLSYLDDATDETDATSDAVVRRVVFEGSDVDSASLDEPSVVVPLATVDGESASNGARSGGGNGNSGGEEDLKPFLSGGYGKAGYADFVFSADDASVHTFDVSGWFTNPVYYSPTTYSVVDENLAFVDATLSASSNLQIGVVDKKVGVGSFTVRATNMFGSCDVTINVYSGRVVGYALEEKVWGGDWGGVEDSGTSESGVGWNLLWRENEYRWTPIFDGGFAPDADQIRTVAVGVKTGENETTGEDVVSDFASATYNLQYDSGGSDATAENIPNPWPCVVGKPSGYGEKEIAMSVTLSGADISDNSKYCVATSTATLKQNNDDPETAVNRSRVAVTEVQSVTWEEPTDSSRPTRLQDDPQDSGTAQRFFPEQLSPTSNVVANQIRATVTLAAPIPDGMEGTVSLNWFDPANPIGSQTPIPLIDGQTKQAAGKRDNNGAAELSTIELTFNQSLGTSKRSAALTVTQANAGDNYVVAAHPNASGVDRYWITETFEEDTEQLSGSPIMRPNDENNASVELAEHLKTPKLTVWRTLWVERDQFTLAPNNVIQAGFPSIGGVVTSELARACIDVRDYAFDNSIASISASEFAYDAEHNITNTVYPGRNSPPPTNNFWTVRVIGAFRPEANDVYFGEYYGNTILVFNWSLENAVTDWNEKYNDNIGVAESKQRTVLHELCHALWLEDILEDDDLNDPTINTGIMSYQDMGPRLQHTNILTEDLKTIQSHILPR